MSHGISLRDVESVAEHSYSTSTIAMLLADMEVQRGRTVDVGHVVRLGLLHDLAETLTFDISKSYLEYLGKRGELIKREIEQSAWDQIVGSIDQLSMRRKYSRLLSEFNAQKTLESQIVSAADALDILFQILAYHRMGYPRALLSDIWSSTDRRLRENRFDSVRRLRRIAVRLYKGAVYAR